jgi:ATP-dependent 26S proteasome regulatory subunit
MEPGERERRQILAARLGKAARLSGGDLSRLIEETKGLSAACVQEVAVSALLGKAGGEALVGMEDLLSALARVKEHVKNSKDGPENWNHGSVGFFRAQARKE